MKALTQPGHVVARLIIAVSLISLSGCLGLFGMGGLSDDFEGNAFNLEFQRSPSEVLEDFRSYLQSQNIEIESSSSGTIKTAPGTLNSNQAMGGGAREMRMKAVVESTGSGSALTVLADYLDPTTGDWERAYIDFGTLNMGGRDAVTSSNANAFQAVRRLLTSRYGEENIEAIDTDLQY